MKLYMYTTKDKYEFPILICDSAFELSEKLGLHVNTVMHLMSTSNKNKSSKSRYKQVEIAPDGTCFCGKTLKHLRNKHGFTRNDLADQINVTKTTIYYWEHGHEPKTNYLYALADVFDVGVDVFFANNSISQKEER